MVNDPRRENAAPADAGCARWFSSLALLVLALLAMATIEVACLEAPVYPCQEHAQCFLDSNEPGRCFAGFCAYPDSSCASGHRYGPSADELSGVCVGGEKETVGGTSSETSDDSGSADASDGCACNSPPSACFDSIGVCEGGVCVYAPRPAGTPCGGEEDPCFDTGVCDGAGNCDGQPVVCDAPTGSCFNPEGTCNPSTGTCTYAPLPEGTACNDGNGCTVGDSCDGAGVCVPGPVCPTDNPCEEAACEAGECVYDALPDGSECGPLAADRCCGGVCVDISSDDAHCGGCFAACVASQSCESVAETVCSSMPVDTTGRCTCAANAECPYGQICRTFTPYNWRCAPQGESACHGAFFQVDGCPNYCGY